MFKNFESYIKNMINISGNIEKTILNESKILYDLIYYPDNKQIIKIDIKNLLPGRFYVINYFYNGNNILSPILALEYKTINNKPILYAVNLEYLPFKLKIKLFSLIFNRIYNYIDKEKNKEILKQEPLKLNFQIMYNILKSNNANYTITAFDVNKIKKIYLISYNLIPQIIISDFKRYNSKSMKELYLNITDDKMKNKLKDLIEEYDNLIEQYSSDSLKYHKLVKSIENKFKLFKNIE